MRYISFQMPRKAVFSLKGNSYEVSPHDYNFVHVLATVSIALHIQF